MTLTASRIISTEELRRAVDTIPATIPPWMGQEGPRLELTIAPGMVRLARRDRNRAEQALERRFGERAKEVRALRSQGLYPGGMTGAKREGITTFTRQARSRMVRTLCTLDYAPLFEQGGQPAMVTLTLPGDWERIAPSAREFKKIVKRFQDRFEYSFGVKLIGVWKLEFQRRGAPHLHILMTPPAGRSRGDGLTFREWLGAAWAGCCKTAELLGPAEAVKHVNAGTGIDYDVRGQWADAKRIAIYYAKHGLYGAKEYQNQAPDLWVSSGTVGRFWGYWGLKKGGSTIDLDMRSIKHDPSPEERLAEVVEKCHGAGIPVSERLLSYAETHIIRADGMRIPTGLIDRHLPRHRHQRARRQRTGTDHGDLAGSQHERVRSGLRGEQHEQHATCRQRNARNAEHRSEYPREPGPRCGAGTARMCAIRKPQRRGQSEREHTEREPAQHIARAMPTVLEQLPRRSAHE